MKKVRKIKKKKIREIEKKKAKPKKKVSKVEVKEVKVKPAIKVEKKIPEKKVEKEVETKVEFKPEERLELIEKVETVPEKKEVVNPKKIKKRERKKRKHKVKKEEIKPKRKIGGGSFIASGILSILVPAMFYVVLGDFSSFLEECSLPFSSVDIGNDMIVNCTEMRFVYILSFLCVFFGAIFIIYGLAKKIKGMKKSPE